MKKAVEDVLEFHKACKVPSSHSPIIIPKDRKNLRKSLINEELIETYFSMEKEDLVGIADGLADLCYVIIGTAIEYGIPLDKVWDEVHRSNMKKVDQNTDFVKFREDGKVMKPDGWHPPDIASCLT